MLYPVAALAGARDARPSLCVPVPSEMRKLMTMALDALHLSGLSLCLASLRAGGATELFKRSANLAIVQYAGRWSSLRTLQHYIQEAAAAQTLVRLDAETRVIVQMLQRHMQFLGFVPPTRRAAIFSNSA